MEIQETQKNEVKVFRLSGRLDSNTSPTLEKKINEAIENGVKNMVVDFEKLDYISSAGLRIILKTTKDLKKRDGAIVLCAMQDYVKEVFEIAGFDSFLPIVPEVDDAVAKIEEESTS
ncbi:MAG TPA: STAS domain-containing protein [Desulfobacterales bacterium]